MSPSLNTILSELKLSQYLEVLLDNGFDSWDIVQDITEPDLDELGFKLGHRRILQRAISENPNWGQNSGASTPISRAAHPSPISNPTEGSLSKRRYRRHPRPDPHAPKRPKTAYVMFADHLRADPIICSQSFVEISRMVGTRWQSLPREEKYVWDIRAAQALQVYTQEMEEYRKTDAFREHQRYLDEFRRKHQVYHCEGYDLALSMQRPTALEASRENSSSSGLSGSTQVEHVDGGANIINAEVRNFAGHGRSESQDGGKTRGRGSRSSIHALLQAAEECDRMDRSKASIMQWREEASRQKGSDYEYMSGHARQWDGRE